MILFCDTSALMKLLVDEARSEQLRQISTTVDAIGVCRISWAESMAALARLQREEMWPRLRGAVSAAICSAEKPPRPAELVGAFCGSGVEGFSACAALARSAASASRSIWSTLGWF